MGKSPAELGGMTNTLTVRAVGSRHSRNRPLRCPFMPEPTSLTASVFFNRIGDTHLLRHGVFRQARQLTLKIGFLLRTGNPGVERHSTFDGRSRRMNYCRPRGQLLGRKRQWPCMLQQLSTLTVPAARAGEAWADNHTQPGNAAAVMRESHVLRHQ